MLRRCSWMLLLLIVAVTAESLATGLMEDVSKADQAMRPKAKRVQELLMFGNQQNRRTDNILGAENSNSYTSNADKRTLGASGLEDVKAPLTSDESFIHKMPSNQIYSRDEMTPYDKNYEYGKVMSNEMSRNWDMPLYYPGFYTLGGEEDRRKRGSDKLVATSSPSSATTTSTSTTTTTTSPPSPVASNAPSRLAQEPLALAERSGMPVYQEPRYKRGLDHGELLTLLSYLENSPRTTNWRNYANDDYDNMEDDRGVVGMDEEDPRDDGAWMAVESPRHFSTGMHGPQAVSAFDIGIPRTHPVNSYDQYEPQYGAPYESTQYGAAQYGSLYPSQSYYTPEKRFLVARKRSQAYDTYNTRNDLSGLSRLMRSYPNFPHRLVY